MIWTFLKWVGIVYLGFLLLVFLTTGMGTDEEGDG